MAISKITTGSISDSVAIDTNTLVVDGTNNRVGVGTSSPSDALNISTSAVNGGVTVSGSTDPQYFLNSAGGNQARFKINDATPMVQTGSWTNIPVGFYTNGTERFRIGSGGGVHINQTADWAASVFSAYAVGGPAISARTNQTNGTCLITRHDGGGIAYNVQFYNGASFVGSIQTTASATSYVTSSDYRLKENVVADWDATTRLKQLNPVRFNFIADPDTTVDGFLAHEVQDIVPEAISGEKDAVDDDGNPVYQGIDQSKLVPLLVKTIQELEARIAALENA